MQQQVSSFCISPTHGNIPTVPPRMRKSTIYCGHDQSFTIRSMISPRLVTTYKRQTQLCTQPLRRQCRRPPVARPAYSFSIFERPLLGGFTTLSIVPCAAVPRPPWHVVLEGWARVRPSAARERLRVVPWLFAALEFWEEHGILIYCIENGCVHW